MAYLHYENNVTGCLKYKNTEFTEKSKNSSNVPHCREIVKIWVLDKNEYSKEKTKCCSQVQKN